MPAKVKARVLAARNLPVMDRSSETTDAFAEVEFKNSKFKTEVCRKSLNPTWPNSDWFRFDVDDCDLQDEPLQIRIMDYDIYSANDAIGKVYIDLNPLLLKADKNRDKQVMLSGWLPIFDTMHGVRGEVNVNVKVELFSDLNKFRASSCGVLFFCSSAPPEGYRTEIISFVEKLCVNDDPEYQWIDKIRTPRASNEARQALFMKLSSIVQRKIGSMALELGANAVLGYRQNFDLEGDSGIVARAIGTAVKVVKESQFDLTKENIVSQNDSNYQVPTTSQGNPGFSLVTNQKLESMFELNKTTTNIFQNLSNPWLISPELEQASFQRAPSPGASTTGLGLVSSLSAAFSKPLESFATASAGPTSWLTRKSSFKAVAAKTMRSVSVTSMAARSPTTSHHRVASIKSAKAAFMRKNSSSDAPSMLQTSPTTSSIGTSVSQDMTELSMPSLERNPSVSPRAPASFWINNDDEDTDDDNLSSKMEVDSIQSEESIPDSFEIDELDMDKDFFNQTDWAKAALQKRLDKGRVDSTTNNEVTFLNTIINQSLTVTDEGKEIRRKLIDETSGASPLILKADCQADSADHLRPPVLTIEPPSPLPYNTYDATMASSQSPLSSESDRGCPTKQLKYSRSRKTGCNTKSSHSFSSVRDRRYLRCNTNNSSSRSSSEPPGTIVIPSSQTNIDNSDLSNDTDSNSTNLSSSHPSHRLIDNSKTSSRHASGESDNTTTGCSPKVSSALSFGVPPLQQQQQLKSKLSTKISSSGKMEGYLEILEHPFLTLRAFPEGFVQRIGGLVCCRSVKLLDGDLQDNKHKALREAWWQEIRHEIRTHAMTLGCNLVVGYSEDTSIFEDIVVLSANGTAVTARLNPESLLSTMFGPLYTKSNGKSVQHGGAGGIGNAGAEDSSNATCSMLHIPFHSPDFTLPFTWSKKNCHFCGAKNAFVPDVMFTTIEPPVDQLLMVGRGCVLQAKVIRLKKDLKGENNAKEISDALPFIEYEIHRQLINKLKVKGMNAIFGLKMTLTLSDRVMVATALGTAVYLAALPSPSPPRLVHHRDDQEYLMRMQRRLEEKISENMDYHGITNEQVNNNRQLQRQQRCSSSMEEDDTTNDNGDGVLNNGDFELNSQPSDHGDLLGNKDVCVLEIDDTEDSEILESILDRFPPPGIQVFSTEELIGISKGHIVKSNQLFSQIWRGKIQPTTKDLTKICQRLLSAIYFKLRKLKPCLVSNLTMKADVDEENEIQLTFTGIAIALAHDGKTRQELASELTHLEENSEKSQEAEATVESASVAVEKTVTLNKMRSPNFYMESKAQEGIVLTPQSFVCGGRIEKYLGNLNFFLIRETSSLREAGGLSHFVQSFICEIQCIVRAHVMSLGGNALLSYFMSEFVIMHNPHKNQAQCLLHVGGDAVLVNFSPLM